MKIKNLPSSDVLVPVLFLVPEVLVLGRPLAHCFPIINLFEYNQIKNFLLKPFFSLSIDWKTESFSVPRSTAGMKESKYSRCQSVADKTVADAGFFRWIKVRQWQVSGGF